MHSIRFFLVLVFNLGFVGVVCAQNGHTPSLCGPRCVKHVLGQYGRDVDLAELIVEMQGGLVGGSSSIEDIVAALRKRGVYSKAIQTSVFTLPKWPHPVILHFRRGHFAILGTTEGAYAQIRDGAAMEPTWAWIPSVMVRQSGAVVLTSDAPIERGIPLTRWPRLAAAFFCTAIGATGLWLRRIWLSRTVAQFSSSKGVSCESASRPA